MAFLFSRQQKLNSVLSISEIIIMALVCDEADLWPWKQAPVLHTDRYRNQSNVLVVWPQRPVGIAQPSLAEPISGNISLMWTVMEEKQTIP